jgi:hypothetical protein
VKLSIREDVAVAKPWAVPFRAVGLRWWRIQDRFRHDAFFRAKLSSIAASLPTVTRRQVYWHRVASCIRLIANLWIILFRLTLDLGGTLWRSLLVHVGLKGQSLAFQIPVFGRAQREHVRILAPPGTEISAKPMISADGRQLEKPQADGGPVLLWTTSSDRVILYNKGLGRKQPSFWAWGLVSGRTMSFLLDSVPWTKS